MRLRGWVFLFFFTSLGWAAHRPVPTRGVHCIQLALEQALRFPEVPIGPDGRSLVHLPTGAYLPQIGNPLSFAAYELKLVPDLARFHNRTALESALGSFRRAKNPAELRASYKAFAEVFETERRVSRFGVDHEIELRREEFYWIGRVGGDWSKRTKASVPDWYAHALADQAKALLRLQGTRSVKARVGVGNHIGLQILPGAGELGELARLMGKADVEIYFDPVYLLRKEYGAYATDRGYQSLSISAVLLGKLTLSEAHEIEHQFMNFLKRSGIPYLLNARINRKKISPLKKRLGVYWPKSSTQELVTYADDFLSQVEDPRLGRLDLLEALAENTEEVYKDVRRIMAEIRQDLSRRKDFQLEVSPRPGRFEFERGSTKLVIRRRDRGLYQVELSTPEFDLEWPVPQDDALTALFKHLEARRLNLKLKPAPGDEGRLFGSAVSALKEEADAVWKHANELRRGARAIAKLPHPAPLDDEIAAFAAKVREKIKRPIFPKLPPLKEEFFFGSDASWNETIALLWEGRLARNVAVKAERHLANKNSRLKALALVRVSQKEVRKGRDDIFGILRNFNVAAGNEAPRYIPGGSLDFGGFRAVRSGNGIRVLTELDGMPRWVTLADERLLVDFIKLRAGVQMEQGKVSRRTRSALERFRKRLALATARFEKKFDDKVEGYEAFMTKITRQIMHSSK